LYSMIIRMFLRRYPLTIFDREVEIKVAVGWQIDTRQQSR
jgi:hypothetical protein